MAMRWWDFTSTIQPFINVRWGSVIYPQESLSVAINNWIQDIYNEYDWSWLVTTTIIKEEDWEDSGQGFFICTKLWPIKRMLSFDVNNWDRVYNASLIEVKTIPSLSGKEADSQFNNHNPASTFMINDTDIYSLVKHNGVITYRRDYVWDLFNTDWTKLIPLPDRFIPALYYLVLSQIDLIEVVQADDQSYSNYGKYANKIKTLKESDTHMVSKIWWGNRN